MFQPYTQPSLPAQMESVAWSQCTETRRYWSFDCNVLSKCTSRGCSTRKIRTVPSSHAKAARHETRRQALQFRTIPDLCDLFKEMLQIGPPFEAVSTMRSLVFTEKPRNTPRHYTEPEETESIPSSEATNRKSSVTKHIERTKAPTLYIVWE
jgi:hypothetical protein